MIKEEWYEITAYEVRPDEEPVIRNLCEKYGIKWLLQEQKSDDTTLTC